jgi:hypothetical protein
MKERESYRPRTRYKTTSMCLFEESEIYSEKSKYQACHMRTYIYLTYLSRNVSKKGYGRGKCKT